MFSPPVYFIDGRKKVTLKQSCPSGTIFCPLPFGREEESRKLLEEQFGPPTREFGPFCFGYKKLPSDWEQQIAEKWGVDAG
jgi:hypothetical protein